MGEARLFASGSSLVNVTSNLSSPISTFSTSKQPLRRSRQRCPEELRLVDVHLMNVKKYLHRLEVYLVAFVVDESA